LHLRTTLRQLVIMVSTQNALLFGVCRLRLSFSGPSQAEPIWASTVACNVSAARAGVFKLETLLLEQNNIATAQVHDKSGMKSLVMHARHQIN